MDYVWNKAVVTVGKWTRSVAGEVALYRNPVITKHMKELSALMKRHGGEMEDARVVAAMDNLMRLARYYSSQGMSYAPEKKEVIALLAYEGKLDTEAKIKEFLKA